MEGNLGDDIGSDCFLCCICGVLFLDCEVWPFYRQVKKVSPQKTSGKDVNFFITESTEGFVRKRSLYSGSVCQADCMFFYTKNRLELSILAT